MEHPVSEGGHNPQCDLAAYSVVRDLTRSVRFPPLDEAAVRALLLKDADDIVNQELARRCTPSTGTPPSAAQTPPSTTIDGGDVCSRCSFNLDARSVPASHTECFQLVRPRPLQPLFPGGVFGSMSDALTVASETTSHLPAVHTLRRPSGASGAAGIPPRPRGGPPGSPCSNRCRPMTTDAPATPLSVS